MPRIKVPRYYLENPFEFAECLRYNETPFTLTSTSFTKKIEVDGEIYYFTSSGKLKNTDLNLIKAVKNYCEKLVTDQFDDAGNLIKEGLKIPAVDTSKIGYIKVNTKFKNAIHKRDIFEIDLKSAYWNLAYRHGFIDKKIYYKGMNLNDDGTVIEPLFNKWGNIYNHTTKMGRLIALGNLAKVFKVFSFDGLKYSDPQDVRSFKTENIFFRCSMEVDLIMRQLIELAGSNYLFYWVDAIFVRGSETVDLICEFLTNEIGLDFKIVPIKKLVKTPYYIKVWDETNLNKKGDMVPRPYIFKSLPKHRLDEVLDIASDSMSFSDNMRKFLNK